MRTKINLAFLLMQSIALCSVAQTSYDVSPLMEQELSGTARYLGMGGAMGAFGSDLSVIGRNPAGIGTYKTDESSISLSFSGSHTDMFNPGKVYASDGTFISYSAKRTNSDIRFFADNVSFVVNLPTSGSLFSDVNLAFAYRRAKDVDRSIVYMDDCIMPWGGTEYRDYANNQRIRTNAFDFNISFNTDDQFYWGLTFETLHSYLYNSGHYYHYIPVPAGVSEEPVDINSVDFANDMSAIGWNVKLGVIARPNAGNFRFGVSFATPTLYNVDQIYDDKLYAVDGEKRDGKRFEQSQYYRFSSPWVINASLGYSTAHTAFGLEYDCNIANRSYLRINGTKLTEQGGYTDFQPFSVIRAGVETNVSKFSFRLGYNYNVQMFDKDAHKYLGDTSFNNKRMDITYENQKDAHTATFGVGYCSSPGFFGGQFYADAAFVYNWRNSELHLAEYPDIDPVTDYLTGTGKFVLTFGVTF